MVTTVLIGEFLAGSRSVSISMQNLPALEGTERQIAYAEDLRKREITRINEEIQELQQLSDSDYIMRVGYGISGENVSTPIWATNMGLGIKGEDGRDLFDSKGIVKIADDYDESYKAHEYRKEMDEVLDMRKIADVIQKNIVKMVD